MEKIRFFFIAFLLFPKVFIAQDIVANEDLMFSCFDKGLAQMYVLKDSAYVHFEKAADLAKGLEDYGSFLGVLDHIVITANYHDDIEKYQVALKRMDSLLSDKKIQPQIKDLDYWETAYSGKLALYYNKTKEYIKAKDIFLRILSDWKGIPNKELGSTEAEMLYSINGYMGTIYRFQGKFELAEQYYLSNISLVEANELFAPYRDSYRIGVLQMLAQLYTQMDEHVKANAYYKQNLEWAKEFYAKDRKYKNNVLNAYQKITLSYITQDSLQKALYLLDESKPYLLAEDPFYKDALMLYGTIYSGLNKEQKALDNYQEALAVFTEFRGNNPHQDIAEVYGRIAELQLKQKNYQEGLKTIQKAFNASGNNVQITDFNQNPDSEEVFSKTQLLSLLNIKLQLLQGSFEETADMAYQNAVLQTSRDILSTFDLLKSEFDSKFDKQFLAEKAYPIFHRMLETTYKAYEKNPSSETIQLALNIAEKNKDFLLLEALRNAQATEYGDVPINILEKEAQLRAEITKLEKQLFDVTETEGGFSDALFNRKQEYYAFLDTLKTNYPKYHELKYQNRTLDLSTVREKLLDDNGTLISYTMADDYLYAIVMNGAKQDFLKLSFDEQAREAIKIFYRLISSPSIKGAEKEISEIAESLFEKTLKRPLADFDSENLTIIPDGELHYLPFDLLQENGSYLLETKNIGYGNSVTSLLELKEKRSAKTNKMLAFAPSFSGAISANSDRQFGKLLYNDDEVQKVSTYYDTKMLFKNKATLSNFKTNASRFNIFHLATHASANDEYPDYSYLAFTEVNDSTESNVLYIKDLYNTTFNADMVTLSACQTGIGKLQKGQGMMSLSKGFFYAGAKSLVNTLWKINDKSTVRLMEYFYEGLSKGYSKSEALRKAKLKYLESTDDNLLKHPYYWSAFVVSGDNSPIEKSNTHWWIIGVVIFICITVWWLSRMVGK